MWIIRTVESMERPGRKMGCVMCIGYKINKT